MNSTDPRDMTWQEIRDGLTGVREAVWNWLLYKGPATTAAIADGTGIGLLTVRPRVSELVAWGFVECIGRAKAGGLYQAVTIQVAHARHQERSQERQLDLEL
jgi:hypothetical protein